MSWFKSRSLTCFQSFTAEVIKCGPIPQHIAVIMDGNRRYARKRNMHIDYGHSQGFEKMKDLTYWCKVLGIREVTAYAFSIENFRRTVTEVNALMDLTRRQFTSIVEGLVDFMKDDICIRVIGDLDLLPDDLKSLAAQITYCTKNNKSITLNIAYAYTARHEITSAIKDAVEGVQSGYLDTSDIDEELLSLCMFTRQSKDPEILIRTSGETRLSDFLLWQSRFTNIYVEDFMWPEFNFWNLLKIIFLHQRTCKENPQDIISNCEVKQTSDTKKRFFRKLDYTRMRILEKYINNNNL